VIDLGRPALHAEGVTLFPDHADPLRFHYLADSPRLAVADDGKPALRLIKYRLDPSLRAAVGAGMLSLTVDLAVDEERLRRLGRLLADRFSLPGPPTLGPVSPDGGHCQVVIIDRASDGGSAGGAGGFGLVQRIFGSAQPSLYGDEAATFMATLSAEGVATIEGALRQGALPVGVVYGLEVAGIRPALRARITARWRDIYHFYENRLHGGKLLAAVDIGATVNRLVHDEALHVEVDELVPESQRQGSWEQAVDHAQRYILETLFVPTLGTAPPPAESSSDVLATIGNAIKDVAGFFSVTYSLKQVDRDELKTLTYALDVASAETLTLAPQGMLSALVPHVDVDALITAVEPAAADDMIFDVGVLVDLDAYGIDRLEVSLRYGDHVTPLTLDGKTPRSTVTLFYQAALGRAVQYSYSVHFRPGGGTIDVLESGVVASEDRIIRIDPRSLYQLARLDAIAEGVPWDRFPMVTVDLRATDPDAGVALTETLQLDAKHTEARFAVRARLDAAVRFQRRLRYVDAHGSETVVDWDFVPAGRLLVPDPFPAILDVAVVGSARFGTEIRRLIVELRLRIQPDQVTTLILTQDQPFGKWSAAVKADADRSWEYRVTVETVRHEVRAGDWMAGAGGRLVVGESFAQLRQVQLMFVGRSLAELHLLALKLRFAFDDETGGVHAEDERLIKDVSAPQSWSYPVASSARLGYSYQLTLIHDDGRLEVRDPVATSDLLVVCPLT
jgi:hypothetical protein